MAKTILSFFRWIQTHWRDHWHSLTMHMTGDDGAPVVAGALALDLETTPERPRARPQPADPQSSSSIWHLRTTILDRLSEYFACIDRLFMHDRRAYHLFARVGFTIPADEFEHRLTKTFFDTSGPIAKLPHTTKRVTFGGILIHHRERDDIDGWLNLSFCYFEKTKPIRVQTDPEHRGDIYRVVFLYDDRNRERQWKATTSQPAQFYVRIGDDGQLTLLKELVTKESTITSRRNRTGRRESIAVKASGWDYPWFVYSLIRDWEQFERKFVKRPLTPEVDFGTGNPFMDRLLLLFGEALSIYNETRSKIVVRVRKRSRVAAFGIPLDRAKVFFKDRDIDAPARDGRRKRIFHAVTRHDRRIGLDRVTNVKAHYRGIRAFAWNNHDVRIVLPDLNYILDFNAPATEFDPSEPITKGWLDQREIGQIFDKKLSQ